MRVNALCPGGVRTAKSIFVERYSGARRSDAWPGRTTTSGALVFLASDASRYMTGANLVVDGGLTAW